MIIICHLCVPQGESMHQTLTCYMNEIVKPDNRRVIAAMLQDGQHVPDTVGELGLRYVPEQHVTSDDGEPIVKLYGMAAMVTRGQFSCGDAAGYEAAVLEEKYGIPTLCQSVAQGDDDAHAVIVTRDRVIDPTLNFLQGRRDQLRTKPLQRTPSACIIENNRVICEEEMACSIDERGLWSCPALPGLTGRRESVVSLHDSKSGSWAKIKNGAVVPVKRRYRP